MPAPKPTRTRRSEARPTEIIHAALAEFSRRGYAATRLEDVAAAAGIGKGTIYLYFPTKQDLFEAVVRQELLPNLEAAETLIAGHAGSASDLLRRFAAVILGVVQSDITAVPKLVISEAGNFPELARFYAEAVIRRGLGLLAAVFARGIASGEFRRVEPHSVAPLFFAPVLMLVVWKHSFKPHTTLQLDPATLLDTHVDMFLRGLAAAAPAPEPPA